LAVTSDDKYIVSGSYDNSLKVLNLQTKQQVHHFRNVPEENNEPQPIVSVTVTSDHRFVVSGSKDGTIKVCDLYTKQQICRFQAHQSK